MFRVDPDRTRWFLECVLPHEPALRAWLSSKRRVGIDVDDIIQETYTALAARETVEDIEYPRAYVFKTAHALVVRHVRRSRIVSIQAKEDLEWSDDAPSPEQVVIDRDVLRQVSDAISAMPGQAQTAFVLRRVHGLSQREIASRMRVSENTVEKHIGRGLRFLLDWVRDGGTAPAQTSKPSNTPPQDPAALDGRPRNQPEHRRRRRDVGGAS
ncbi:hypothetical protein E1H18_3072 [Caulobacter sp. RHG1]|nr:sigma-70 family RNA polymerase sigma factor [Caulobacter sp. RHG1]NQE62816.1 hypothetical protein [Caulobacter sp. RHG1]